MQKEKTELKILFASPCVARERDLNELVLLLLLLGCFTTTNLNAAKIVHEFDLTEIWMSSTYNESIDVRIT